MERTLLILFLIILGTSPVLAEVFQGEVVEVDRVQGRVTMRNTNPEAQVSEHWVFHLNAARTRNDPFTALEGVAVGDEIQVDAVQQNGVWQVQGVAAQPQTLNTQSSVRIINPTAVSARPVDVFASVNNPPAAVVVTANSTAVPLTPVNTAPPFPESSVGVLTSASTPAQTTPASVTGINNLSSTFAGTTVTPSGIFPVGNTSSGGTGSTFSGAGTTTSSGAAGTPTRNGAEGVPARSGAQGVSQSL